jgi:2-polyprenyl-6-methoxyphenol hydroxylase-like FAD-dependent oxidoreductase
MHIHTSEGTVVHSQQFVLEDEGFPFCNTHRAYFQFAFSEFATEIGVKVNYGERITEYFENDKEAGVISNGLKHIADIVVGADGVRSRARSFVTKCEDIPVSSGFAIYRAWFPTERLAGNPLTKSFVTNGDSMNAWIGPDVHCFVTTNEAMKCVSYVLTHKDEYTVEESWSFPGHVEDILRIVKDWDPVLKAIVRVTPKNRLIDWKLLWRDPIRKWVSEGGRVAISGDAAHPFLPSSGNGASQAIEDSVTIATALRLAGRENVELALRAYETLRYFQDL